MVDFKMRNKNLKRALRRHHFNRMKRKYLKQKFWFFSPDDRIIGITARTPAQCSCYMCGNPRKHYKEKTIQEKIADERYESEKMNNEENNNK
jgi:hypothetical protein